MAVGTDRVSDEAVVRRTGRPWDEWFAILDRWGATGRSHAEIARYLNEEQGVPGWWAQTVTVGYERARGLREKYEHADGYSVGASKTIAMGVDELSSAFLDEPERQRWLPGSPLRLRTATPARSARFDWEDGSSRVSVYFSSKGDSKSVVTVQHERLTDAEEAERMRRFWRERLAALAALSSS